MTVEGTIQERFELNPQSGEFGVEIEMESDTPILEGERGYKEWHKFSDGSLRGMYNAEFVLTKPLSLAASKAALHNLQDKLTADTTIINDSVRAGVHIHVNVQTLTVPQLLTLLTAYYILEEMLVDECGDGRKGNHFCLRAQDSDYTLFILSEAVRMNDIVSRLYSIDRMRYSAMNLAALRKFGSIEFRAIRTPTDLTTITYWLDVFNNLKNNFMLYQDPIQMVENISLGGEINFLDNILGPELSEQFKSDPDTSEKLLRGVRLAQEIAYSQPR